MPDPVSKYDTIRYGKIINGSTFNALVAPTLPELSNIEELRSSSINLSQAVGVDDPTFIRIVQADGINQTAGSTIEVNELVNEFCSVFVNNCSFVAAPNCQVTDALISKDKLEFYAKLADSRIVNYELDLQKFIDAYRAASGSPRLIMVKNVCASEKVWARVLQLTPNKKTTPKIIVNPYSETYSQIVIRGDEIVYKRYLTARHPIFDDYVEKVELTADEITRAVYQQD